MMQYPIVIGHSAYSFLFGIPHRFRRTPLTLAASVFHLEKDQILTVIPDQIDFSLTAPEILLLDPDTPG